MDCHAFGRRLGAAMLALAMTLAAFPAPLVHASSHREAPSIIYDPAADLTDVYAFVSPNDPNMVTFILNVWPLMAPGAGPNFYGFDDSVLYALHIDNDGDARKDITYAFRFHTRQRDGMTFLYNTAQVTDITADDQLNVRQRYSMYRYEGDHFNGSAKQLSNHNKVVSGIVAPGVVGPRSFACSGGADCVDAYGALRDQSIVYAGNRKVFAGPADDPFYVDLKVFDLLNVGGNDSLAGANVMTIAFEVPISEVVRGDDVIGVWATTSRRKRTVLRSGGRKISVGPWVQVARLGNPLVNEVVIPRALKDAFNSLDPSNDIDVADAVAAVTDPELAGLFNLVFGKDVVGVDVPTSDRQDLVTIFLTGIPGVNQPTPLIQPAEMLRLNTAMRDSAFPNGRWLEDDVTDAAIQAVAGKFLNALHPDHEAVRNGFSGELVNPDLGDGVGGNDKNFDMHFPYVALPHLGF